MRYVCAALALAAGGCGSVKGACPGDSNDGIDCTADICDLNTNQWVHLPDNNACDPGEVCTANGGCEASALIGSAFLLGHDANDPDHDHSGITVTLLQASGSATGSGSASAAPLTATTGPDGSWSIAAAPGSYTVQYSKAEYFSATTPSVVVGADGGGAAPAVTLSRYQAYNGNVDITDFDDAEFTGNYLISFIDNSFGQAVYSTPLDASTDAVQLFGGSYNYFYPTSTHAVWTSNDQTVVWSRPLDGSTPPVKLLSAAYDSVVYPVGTPGAYTVIYQYSYATALASLWIAKTDGSVVPSTPAWTQTDASHPFQQLVNNDATALFFTGDSTASPPTDGAASLPAHRIDLASNATSDVSVGTASSGLTGGLYPSPDGKWLYGTIVAYNGGSPVYRGFIAAITASPPSSLITLSTAPLSAIYSDDADGYFDWLADSSAFVFESADQGDLRVWKPSMPAASSIIGEGNYNYLNWFGNIIFYQDATLAIHAYGLTDNSLFDIDGSATQEYGVQATQEASGEVYAVVTEYNSGDTGVGKAVAVDIPGANTVTGATATTLFTSVAQGCSYIDALSDTTYYQYCYDSGTLTAYAKSSSTPAFQVTGLLTNALAPSYIASLLTPLPQAESAVFPMADENLYSVSNSATGNVEPVLVSSHFDPEYSLLGFGNWIFLADTTNELTRVSNVSGSGIDEPLDTCNMLDWDLEPDPTGMRLWTPYSYCQGSGSHEAMVPVANLP